MTYSTIYMRVIEIDFRIQIFVLFISQHCSRGIEIKLSFGEPNPYTDKNNKIVLGRHDKLETISPVLLLS